MTSNLMLSNARVKHMSDTAQHQPQIHPTIEAIVRQCADFLAPQQLAEKTVTNYLSDIRLFLEWSSGQHQGLFLKELENDIHAYRAALLDSATPIATINRHLASLRQFGAFLTTVHQIEVNTKSLKNISVKPQKPESTPSNTNDQAIEQFGLALAARNCSHSTIENYLGDVRQFAVFASDMSLFDARRKDCADKFMVFLRENSASNATVRRKKVSLKQFYAWAKQSEYIKSNIFETFEDKVLAVAQKFIPLEFFERNRERENQQKTSSSDEASVCEESSLHASDNHGYDNKKISILSRLWRRGGDSNSNSNRFESQQLSDAFPTFEITSPDGKPGHAATGKRSSQNRDQKSTTSFYINDKKQHPLINLYSSYTKWPVSSYLHLAILVLFVSMLGAFGYKQFFLEAGQKYAFPTSLTRPNRILSFQGRLTDSAGTPITVATSLKFRLFNHITAGTGDAAALWASGTCSITPDQDGIFTTLLGSACGPEIPPEIFSENQNVYLEVQVSSETLTPRQQIATVGYALNAETLQGYPASASAVENTIPVFNNSGDMVIGLPSPEIRSESGTFALKGNALSFASNTGTGGNITLAPDGVGQVSLIGGTTSQDFIDITNANLTTGKLIKGTVGNNNTGYKFLSFVGGSTPSEKFYVNALGGVYAGNSLFAPVATISATNTSATPLIINGTGGQIFSIANGGNIVGAGTLTGLTGLTSSGTITFSGLNTAGAVAYTNGSGVLGVTAQGVSGYLLGSGGAGTPTWIDPATVGSNYWQLTNKVISPGNSTHDLAIGGNATSSALFQVFGNTGNATTAGTLTFNGAAYSNNVIAATKMSGLQIGDSSTGNIIFNQNGNVGVGTTGPGAKLHIAGTNSVITESRVSGANNAGNWFSYFQTDGSNPNVGTQLRILESNVTGLTNGLALSAEQYNGTPRYAIGTKDTSDIAFFINNSETVRFKNGGNVGIGTTSPTALLDIAGDASTSASLVFRAAAPTIDTLNGGNLAFAFSPGGDGGLATKFTIGASGNLTATGTLTGLTGLTSSGTITLSGLSTGVVYNTSGVLASEAQLSASRGGTGADLSAGAQGAVPYFSATGVMSALAPSTAGYMLQTNGAGANPSWVNAATAGVNYWQLTSPVLAPGNTTFDVAIGGNSTASAKFQVFGATGNATTSGTLAFNSSTLAGNLIAATNMRGLTIGDTNTGNVILNGGNVGIGTTGPLYPLEINGRSKATSFAVNSTVTDLVNNAPWYGLGTSNVNLPTGAATQLAGYYGILFQVANGQVAINDSGNVGIGTTGPSSKLEVSGTTSVTGGTGTAVGLNGLHSYFTSNIGYISATQNGTANRNLNVQGLNINLQANGADAVYIQSGGNVGIGTTSPLSKLHVEGIVIGKALTIFNETGDQAIFTASASGTPVFTIGRTGILALNQNSQLNTTGTLLINSTGTLSLNTTNNQAITAGTGLITTAGDFALNGGDLTSTAITFNFDIGNTGTLNFRDGTNTLFSILDAGTQGNASSSGNLTAGGQLQLGRFATAPTGIGAGALYYDTVTQAVYFHNGVSWSQVGSGSGGSSYWNQTLGLLYPLNSTVDLSIGGQSTASAKFAFLNVNSGTPTLSFANQASAIDLTNTTVNALSVEGGLLSLDTQNSRVGIGTTGPDAKLDVLSTTGAQLRLTYTDNSVYTGLTTDSSGNFTVSATGTKVIVSPDLQINGGDILGSTGATRITLVDAIRQTLVSGDLVVSGSIPTGDGFLTVTRTATISSMIATDTPLILQNHLAQNLLTIANSGALTLGTGTQTLLNVAATGALTLTNSTGTQLVAVTNGGNITTNTGNITSSVANGATAVGYTLDTTNTLSTQGSKLVSVKNAGTEKFYIDSSGNLYVAGTVTSSKGLSTLLTNKSGAQVAVGDLVVVDTTTASSFTTTTVAHNKKTFGVVVGIGLGATNDADGDGVCDANDICLVATQGKVTVTGSNTTVIGDYLYSSTTAGKALASSVQSDGLIGIAMSADASDPYSVEMMFVVQPSGGGGGFFSNSNASVADGSYVEVAHNQATNDLNTTGWQYNTNTSQYEQIDTNSSEQATASATVNFNTEGNYTQENMAYAVTLTPSATSGDITLTLGSGTWNSDARVQQYCRVSGNSGVATLTAAPAAQTTITATTTTAFANTNAIASGSWYLYCTSYISGTARLNPGPGFNVGTFATTSQAQLPQPLGGEEYVISPSVSGTNYLYTIGGYNGGNLSVVYKAAINNSTGNVGTWATTSQSQLPAARIDTGAVSIAVSGTNYVYVIGGSASSTVYKTTIDSSANISAFATTSQAQLPAARSGLPLPVEYATIGGTSYIYVIGGDGPVSTVYKATVDGSQNVGTFATTSQGQLLVSLNDHNTALLTIGGTNYLYVIGGYNGAAYISTVYKATIDSSGNVGTFATTSQAQLPANRGRLGVTTVASDTYTYLYLVGGTGPVSTVYRAMVDSSGNVGTFSTTNQGQFPVANNIISANIVNVGGTNYLYAVSGSGSSAVYRATISADTNPVSLYDATKLLLHTDGTDAFTSFTDSSTSSNSMIAVGNAQIDTAQSKFGGASALFDGTGDYLTTPDSANWDLEGVFSIDAWVRFNALSYTYIAATSANDSGYYTPGWRFYYNNANALGFSYSTDPGVTPINVTNSWTPSTNTWYHVAVSRDSNNDIKMFVDGTQIGATSNNSTNITSGSQPLFVGGVDGASAASMNGWLDEVRVIKGVAAWTSNFTAPTSAYNNYSQLYSVVTAGDQISTTTWGDIDDVDVTETLNSQTIYYSVSFDGRTTFAMYDSTANNFGWRPIARNNSGTWQYNSNTTAGVSNVTWTNATYNSQNGALSQAFGVTTNQMSGTMLGALTDQNWNEINGYTSTTATLDFAAGFKSSSSTQNPQVDQINVDYTKAGFKIIQTDTNTARLYNYSGVTKNLRLDVTTNGGAVHSGLYTNSNSALTDGSYVEIAHNQNTTSVVPMGWRYNTNTSKWEVIDIKNSEQATNSATVNFNTESDYSQENMAYAVTLTPSATSGDITLTLGSGTWNSDARVQQYCRVSGNSGVATLTAAPAAQTTITATTTTAFANTSAIASGSWYLYCTEYTGSVARLNTNYVSNAGTFSTTSQGQLPQGEWGIGTVTATIGGTQYIYGVGGFIGAGSYSSTVYKSTIDASGNASAFSTTSQSQFPTGLGYHSVITTSVGGTQYIYAIGNGTSNTSGVYKATIDTSGNIGTFSTTSQGQLLSANYANWATNVTIGGTQYVYVTGGGNGGESSAVYKATIDGSGNIGTFATTSQAQIPTGTLGFHMGATVSISGTQYIYLIGGTRGGLAISLVYKATIDSSGNIGTFATTSQAQLPAIVSNDNSNAIVATVGGTNYLYIVGGHNGTVPISTVYKATIDSSGNIGTFATTSQAQLPQTHYSHGSILATTNGTQYIYTAGGYNASALSTVYRSTIGPDNNPITTVYTTVTAGDQLTTTSWDHVDSVAVTETLNSQTIYYSVSFDGRTTFVKYDSTTGDNGWRPIARNNSGTWQYNSNTTAGVSNVTWTNATYNSQQGAISQAVGVTNNQMSGTSLAALTAVNWREINGFTPTTNTLDFAASFKSSSATQNPQVDQIRVNYTQAGFKIVQQDANTVRLYNYTGLTQNTRMDVIVGGVDSPSNGTVTLTPTSADVDSQSSTNSIWINKTGLDGTLLKLQKSGTDILNLSQAGGNAALILDQRLGGDIFTASASGITKMLLTAAGNLGLGTTSPNSKLHAVTDDTSIGDGTGGTITHSNGYTIHTFTSSGTFTPPTGVSSVEYLVVGGGGGGGGSGGGGGAGGFRTGTGFSVTGGNPYTVTVGGGGTGGTYGTCASGSNGSDSVFSTITSTGGGKGSSGNACVGSSGGSGGGGNAGYKDAGGAGNTPSTSPSQGNDGGTAVGSTSYNGGGGGGASTAGGAGTTIPGTGGAGTASSISGSSVTYAGGGGGANSGGGGAGGGGAGGAAGATGTAGTANTGGGGGAGGVNPAGVGGAGGSGIVIVRYSSNAVTDVLTLDHTTSGTATGGIGTGILMRSEDSAGNLENAGRISGILANATDGTEQSALTFDTRGINYSSDLTTFSTTSQGQLPAIHSSATMVTASIGGTQYIYYMGGCTTNCASLVSTAYKSTIDTSGNLGTFSTTSQAQLPAVNYELTSVTASIGGTQYVYVLGGTDIASSGYSTAYKSTIDTSGNLGTFSTTSQGQLPARYYGPTAVTASIGGTQYVYVISGYSPTTGSSHSTVYKSTVDTSGNLGVFSTTSQAQLPAVRYNALAVTASIGGTQYVYVIGGDGSSNGSGANVSTVYKATIDSSGNVGAFATTSQAQLPVAFRSHSALTTSVGGTQYIYVLGGTTGSIISTVYKAAIDSSGNVGTFATTSQGQLPQALRSAKQSIIATVGGTQYLYHLGGNTGSNDVSTVYKATIGPDTGTTTLTRRMKLDHVGNLTISGTITQSGSPDIAENVRVSDSSIEGGDVVMIDMDFRLRGNDIRGDDDIYNRFVTKKADQPYSKQLLGVISSDPGIVLNSSKNVVYDNLKSQSNERPLAIAGRVPVKIDPSSPYIEKGDYLTASTLPGYAIKATRAGQVIAQALESWDPLEPTAQILVFVRSTYYTGDLTAEEFTREMLPNATVHTSPSVATSSALLPANLSTNISALFTSTIEQIKNRFTEFSTQHVDLVQSLWSDVSLLTARLIKSEVIITDQLNSSTAHIDLLTSTATPSARQPGIALRLDPTFISFVRTATDSVTPSTVVASIDTQGNATFSGELQAYSVRTQKLRAVQAELESLNIMDASISGTLYANSIFGLDDKISSAVQNAINSATPSGALTYVPPSSTLDLINSLLPTNDASIAGMIAMLNQRSGGHVTGTEVIAPTAVLVNEFLSVQGLASFTYGEFSTALSVNGNNQALTVTGNSISLANTNNATNSAQSNTLYIQPSGNGSLRLLGNRMILNDSGDISINGNLYVNGSIYTKDIQTETIKIGLTSFIGSSNTTVSTTFADAIATDSADSAALTLAPGSSRREQLLALYNEHGDLVGSINHKGQAKFNEVIAQEFVVAAPTQTASDSGQFNGQALSNATAGVATLSATTTETTIANINITNNTLIYLTPLSNTQNQVLYVKTKTDGQGFTVAMNQPIHTDISFTYWLVRVESP